MYTVKVQHFDLRATGRDVAQPMIVETVGRLERTNAAEAYARMWERHDNVAAVWIETDHEWN